MLRKAAVALILCIALLGSAAALPASDIDAVRTEIYAWGKAWESRNIDRYMSFYSPVFRSKGHDYHDWLTKKTKLFQRHSSISLEISDLWVFIEGERASATFVQRYQDSTFSDVGEKTLTLVKMHDTWKIVSEEWKPLDCALPVITCTQKNTVPTHSKETDNNYQGKEIIDSPAKKYVLMILNLLSKKKWKRSVLI